jgi:hypothetical protein
MTDWAAIIFELNRLGMKDSDIDKSGGFSDGYASHLKNGTIGEPGYSRGQKLLQLVKERRAIVPR